MKSKDQLAFGIGCFHFGIKKEPPYQFKGKQYIQELTKTLQGIVNLNNLNIDYDKGFDKYAEMLEEPVPRLSEGEGIFPTPSLFMNIEFDLYIPFRLQAELTKRKEQMLGTYTENFKIIIRYNYFLPVTYIIPVNATEKCSPSEAVWIVKEFLEKEIASSKNEYIMFECLGPSPFHVDCYIQADEKIEEDLDYETVFTPLKGYDEINFNYNAKIYKNLNDASEIIFEDIIDELDFFYYIIQTNVKRMNDWDEIDTLLDVLITSQQVNGVLNFRYKLFSLPTLLNDAFTQIAMFESQELSFTSQIQKEFRDLYKYENYSFKQFIEREISEREKYPTKETFQLINFFEGRRRKNMEIYSILISSFIGGIVGGIITVLLSK
jgi:hypothetical protein